MKRILLTAILTTGACLLTGCILTGCNMASQVMKTPIFGEGSNSVAVIGMQETRVKVFNFGNSTQTLDKSRTSNGKVQVSGIAGLGQESDMAKTIDSVGNLVEKLDKLKNGGSTASLPAGSLATIQAPVTIPTYDVNNKATWPTKVSNLGDGTALVCWGNMPNSPCLIVPMSQAANYPVNPSK